MPSLRHFLLLLAAMLAIGVCLIAEAGGFTTERLAAERMAFGDSSSTETADRAFSAESGDADTSRDTAAVALLSNEPLAADRGESRARSLYEGRTTPLPRCLYSADAVVQLGLPGGASFSHATSFGQRQQRFGSLVIEHIRLQI